MNPTLLFLGGIGSLELIVFFVFAILWIWAIVDLFQSSSNSSNKIIWALVLFLIPFLGVILYFAFGRKKKVAQ
jgi:hypothetical protein